MQTQAQIVADAMDDVRRIEGDLGVTREGVEAIRDRLVEMASQREQFNLEVFPPPDADADSSSILYRLSQDDDDRFALYAQASRGDLSTPVHNHTTWAVVVGFEGQELNRFFDRSDDGVTQTGEHMVQAGTGVAMLPDDLHSIHIEGPSLNFHCYGLALENLESRVYYNPIENNWKVFSNTGAIVESRHGLTSC